MQIHLKLNKIVEKSVKQKKKVYFKKEFILNQNDFFLLDICTLDKDTGTCDQYQIMWYYDTLSGQCKNFYYGSCGGNANRFGTEQECQLRCLLKTGLAKNFF